MPDSLTPSRLVLRLNSEISSASSQLAADCKRLELAGYLARLGKFDESEIEIDKIRNEYLSQPVGVITIWLNLIEGISILSKSLDLCARDKVLRAYALSYALKNKELQSLSAAWLAHIDYLKGQYESMVAFIAESFVNSEDGHRPTRTRLSLVVATAYQFAGCLETALIWYKKAHIHATTDGDNAMLGALMHNTAWMKAYNLRFCEWESGNVVDDNSQVLMAANSTANFNELIGAKNLKTSVPMATAMILSACGKYDAAMQLYDQHSESIPDGGLSRWEMELLIDAAWCAANLGGRGSWVESTLDFILRNPELAERPPDQRFLVYSRAHQIQVLCGDHTGAKVSHDLTSAAIAEHKLIQSEVFNRLSNCLSQFSVDS